MNIKISLLLHFYQPWWQYQPVLERIVNECYRPILNILKNAGGFCFSANINYSLIELLEKAGFGDVICGFKTAAKLGKIELLGSTAYHPIMPLIPDFLQRASLEKDTLSKQKYFGIEKNCDGIFLPEMAFSKRLIPILKKFGYRWSVIDDEQFKFQYHYAPFDHIIAMADFKIFLRSRLWSNRISYSSDLTFEGFWKKLECEISSWTRDQPAYLVLAMDAETFGHYSGKRLSHLFVPMLARLKYENMVISFEELAKEFPQKEITELCDGSWSTEDYDYGDKVFFPLWKLNERHKILWRLADIALEAAEENGWKFLDDCMKITASCNWWWLSERSERNPELAKHGARLAFELIKRYSALSSKKNNLEEAERLFNKIMSWN